MPANPVPGITVNDTGSGTYVTDVTSSGHTITLTRGTPSIPAVNNPTITIKQNGTTKGSFTLNQSGATTIELTDTNNISETGYVSTSSVTLTGICGFILIAPASAASSTITLSSLNSPTSVSFAAYGTTQKIMIYYTQDTASGYYFLSGTYYNTNTTTVYHIQARTDATFNITGGNGCYARVVKITD